MTNVERRFEDALAAFSLSGNRWEGVKGLTYWGAALGMSADDVIAAAHGVGVHSRDADIRRSMVSAAEKVAANAARFSNRTWCASYHNEAPRRSPKPKVAGRVRELIEAGQDVETEDALRAMSPVDIGADDNPMSSKAVCEIQLARLFAPADMVRIRRSKDDNTKSQAGANLKTLGDWLSGDIHPAEFGEIVRVNPLTGKEGLTRDGRASFDAQSCIAAYRHVVMEFDLMPWEQQIRFWAGFIRRSPLSERLTCLVYSGGKSIHGVLRVDAPNESKWMEYKAKLLSLYAADPDNHYRIDGQAMMPLTGCRLAGATRNDTGRTQKLLWACASPRDGHGSSLGLSNSRAREGAGPQKTLSFRLQKFLSVAMIK